MENLKDKVLSLPLLPGVYIMKDASGTVIYVGKAKKLKNRVSQYFQTSASHSPKTRMMVSKIADFDVFIAKQGVRTARSEYFPKINASVGTEYTKNFKDFNCFCSFNYCYTTSNLFDSDFLPIQ